MELNLLLHIYCTPFSLLNSLILFCERNLHVWNDLDKTISCYITIKFLDSKIYSSKNVQDWLTPVVAYSSLTIIILISSTIISKVWLESQLQEQMLVFKSAIRLLILRSKEWYDISRFWEFCDTYSRLDKWSIKGVKIQFGSSFSNFVYFPTVSEPKFRKLIDSLNNLLQAMIRSVNCIKLI